MDAARLRELLTPLVDKLHSAGSHRELPRICASLGLPTLPDDGSKWERVTASFTALPDAELIGVAQRFLDRRPPDARARNEIQDLIWSDARAPEIPKRIRREIAKALPIEDLVIDARRFDQLLDRLWVLDDEIDLVFGSSRNSLRARVERHVHRNPGDWSVLDLFDALGAFESTHRRFALFLEGLASAEVRPEVSAQRRFVARVGEPLAQCGLELRETGVEDGYPIFTIVAKHTGSAGRPKNLIFASSVKPDLRFRDAVNNDIEIVTNADQVLVYDRPIAEGGLTWNDLQTWWSETQGVKDPQEAKKTLYRRLLQCLPDNSPPQKRLFEGFYRGYGRSVRELPALLPEIWLHWDPKTARERGPEALARFRMDFLLLLPHAVRVVVEVDGRHHYANDEGKADPTRYAKMVSADRDLRLAGYQVFRFGAHELLEDSGDRVVKPFFDRLFKEFGVEIPAGRSGGRRDTP